MKLGFWRFTFLLIFIVYFAKIVLSVSKLTAIFELKFGWFLRCIYSCVVFILLNKSKKNYIETKN